MSRALQQTIHVACRQLGLDGEARRDLQVAVTGKASMRDMDEADLKLVIKRLEDDGFERAKPRHRTKRSDNGSIRLIHVLWRKLGEKGVLKDPSKAGLNKFIRSRFSEKWGYELLDINQLREWSEIEDVVEALRAWGNRVNIDFDWGQHRR
ncbi:MAG: regulatory protein GemA [Rhodobacteraceae bacterium]|nr:regulatory protein GemA [Paracoccaceae bacterium]MCW9041720.1 regulatory protein GemA [Pseudopelagicola sp.]